MTNKSTPLTLRTAYLLLFLTSLFWATTTIIMKIYIEDIPAFHLMMGRFLLAAILFYAIRHKHITLNKRLLMHGAAIGFFLFLAYYFSIVALKHTTASKAGFLVALSVLWVPLAQLAVHRKKPTFWVNITVLLSMLGLYWISGLDGVGFNWGDGLALFCSISYTAYIMYIDKYAKEMDGDQMTFVILLVVAILSIGSMIAFEGFNGQVITDNWLTIVIIAIIGTTLTTYFQTKAQHVASPEAVGIILLGEPLFTLVMAILILKETVTPLGLIGGALLLLSLFIAVVKKI